MSRVVQITVPVRYIHAMKCARMCIAANNADFTMGTPPQKYPPRACQATSPRLVVRIGAGRELNVLTIPRYA